MGTQIEISQRDHFKDKGLRALPEGTSIAGRLPTTDAIDVPSERTTGCTGTAYLDCCPSCGHHHIRWRGCGKRTCPQPGCVQHRTGQRAQRVSSRLESSAQGAAWGVVVLTLPECGRRPAARRSVHKRLARAARVIAAAWAGRWCWRGRGAHVRGVTIAHPCGDSGGWAPHFNVLFSMRDRKLGIGRHHVPVAALDDLRARWWRAVVGILGEWGGTSLQVFWEWRSDERRKRHAARYFARHFPGWAPWTHRPIWWGGWEPLKKEKRRNAGAFCALCGSAYTTEQVRTVPPGGKWPPWAKDGEQ